MIQYDVLVFMQAYDPQTGYDLTPYFRPSTMDETVRGQGLPSPQEVNLNAYHCLMENILLLILLHTCMNKTCFDLIFIFMDALQQLRYVSFCRECVDIQRRIFFRTL